MAQETKFVVPKHGLPIRYPKRPKKVLPQEGAWVPWIGPDGRFWRRRQADGSIDVYDNQQTQRSSAPVRSFQREEKKEGGKE